MSTESSPRATLAPGQFELVAKALADPELLAESQKRSWPLSFYSGESDQVRIQRIMQGSTSLTPILKAAAASIK